MPREIGRVMAMSIACKDCGRVFVMGNKEVSWYTQKMGYPLPKRCPECRKRRKGKGNMFSCEEEYAAHCNAMADAEAEIAALEGEAETANDEQIIELARKLVKAINDSGRTVLRTDTSRGGFGSLTIWIHGGNLIEVEHFGKQSYVISGPIDGVE